MAKFKKDDKVYFRQGLEKHDIRQFTITDAVSEAGIDYVYVKEIPEGIFEEKFFDFTPSEDAGRGGVINPVPPPPVDAGPNEKFYATLDELLTAAVAAWSQKLDTEAVQLVTQAIEVLRNMREQAKGAKS